MKIELIIDTKENSVDILHSGYNIIKTTLHNADITKKIYEILKNTINEENFEDIQSEEDFKKYLNLK